MASISSHSRHCTQSSPDQPAAIEVYWAEQIEADMAVGNDWLSAAELARLDRIRFPKRRDDWRLGRWIAKRAVAAYLGARSDCWGLAEIELRPDSSGAPQVFCGGWRAPVSFSLSHRAGRAVCALAEPGVALGCDLELIEPRSAAFASDYFTDEEQTRVARAPAEERNRLLNLLWSGKESALKALRVGLRMDTRCLLASPVGVLAGQPAGGWCALGVFHENGQFFNGWWQSGEGFVRTMVSAPAPAPPVTLHLGY
jgi:4'-phosphopantetheinyl transferase